ncbi:MAG: formate C-acetyltransferase/glycerol dehydratase family glycyl radical enzyme, partial [Deltaproteobacteria bacterium]
GNELCGPTAVMNSITKLPLTRIYNGANLNMRFNGKRINEDKFKALIDTYFKKGGIQVQFNIIEPETLKDAKIRPEKYKDLVVRISGYSALFTGLSETAQDEIISRTEYEL